jgi:hypothetical protein
MSYGSKGVGDEELNMSMLYYPIGTLPTKDCFEINLYWLMTSIQNVHSIILHQVKLDIGKCLLCFAIHN